MRCQQKQNKPSAISWPCLGNMCLVDLYCPYCYHDGKNSGFIAGDFLRYGESMDYYCPTCNKDFRYVTDKEGNGKTLVKNESWDEVSG
jgi:hypothetical protein